MTAPPPLTDEEWQLLMTLAPDQPDVSWTLEYAHRMTARQKDEARLYLRQFSHRRKRGERGTGAKFASYMPAALEYLAKHPGCTWMDAARHVADGDVDLRALRNAIKRAARKP